MPFVRARPISPDLFVITNRRKPYEERKYSCVNASFLKSDSGVKEDFAEELMIGLRSERERVWANLAKWSGEIGLACTKGML